MKSLWIAGAVLVATSSGVAARCMDEEQAVEVSGSTSAASGAADTPRRQLQAMVTEALRRSAAVGASHLLAEAAEKDLQETAAGRQPAANLTGNVGLSGATLGAITTQKTGLRGQAAVSATAPLFDNGRLDALVDWRAQSLEAAKQGEITAQEQVVLQTVSLAVERNRFRVQAQVYEQYARKTACLVEAMDVIVKADKGRASELVQARKTRDQVLVTQEQVLSQLRQTETRLRRFVGDALPSEEGVTSSLLTIPSVTQIQSELDKSSEIAQLQAQAQAQARYAESVKAGQKPQVGWLAQLSRSMGAGDPATNWMLGLSVTVPLFNPAAEPATQAAIKRAEAAKLQLADALDSRKARVVEVNEQAVSAFDRSRRYAEVMRDSDRLRGYTLQQWQQMGKRSLFEVMSAEGDHYNTRIAYVNALHDGFQANALSWSLGKGLGAWLK